jgi:hypothetical protein
MFFSPGDPPSFEQEWASMEIADTQELVPGLAVNAALRFTRTDWLTVVQWDGGPTYSIHGHSTRRLPDLQFSDLWQIPEWEKPVLTVEILADGYLKEISLPVDFIVDGKPLFHREGGKTNPEWM